MDTTERRLKLQGREFTLRPMANGAQELVAIDGGEITEEQWAEYCGKLAKGGYRQWDVNPPNLADDKSVMTIKRKLGRWDA